MTEELSIDNCTASDIIDELGEDMDFMFDPMSVNWKAFFTERAYQMIKNDPGGYIYENGGHEYVKVFDNHTIPFIIHMRIAGIDNSIPEQIPFSLGCRREIDDGQ
jgi:hypothetical protein